MPTQNWEGQATVKLAPLVLKLVIYQSHTIQLRRLPVATFLVPNLFSCLRLPVVLDEGITPVEKELHPAKQHKSQVLCPKRSPDLNKLRQLHNPNPNPGASSHDNLLAAPE